MKSIATLSKSEIINTAGIDINIRWKSNQKSMFDLLRELDSSASSLRLNGISTI